MKLPIVVLRRGSVEAAAVLSPEIWDMGEIEGMTTQTQTEITLSLTCSIFTVQTVLYRALYRTAVTECHWTEFVLCQSKCSENAWS